MLRQSQVASREAPYIFVSYAHVDFQVVHPYVSSLEKQGLRMWWDQGLTPGREWVEQVADAIVECSVFLLLVTRGVADSEYCFRETFFAQNERIPTIVSFVQSVRLPNRLRFLLSSTHAVSDGARECNRLAETLHRALKDSQTRVSGESLERIVSPARIDAEFSRWPDPSLQLASESKSDLNVCIENDSQHLDSVVR